MPIILPPGDPEAATPLLASIKTTQFMLGGIGRTKLYADILPKLETVEVGSRTLVVIASIQRYVAANAKPPRNAEKFVKPRRAYNRKPKSTAPAAEVGA